MSIDMDARMRLHHWLVAQEGCPYLWNHDGERVDIGGGVRRPAYDCSGLVCRAILEMGGPDWRSTYNCQRLFDELKPVETEDELFPFDLAFYGASHKHVTHVMFAWGDGRTFGACGGNRDTVDVETARKKGAAVKFRASVLYRPDFLAYRRFPLRGEEEVVLETGA